MCNFRYNGKFIDFHLYIPYIYYKIQLYEDIAHSDTNNIYHLLADECRAGYKRRIYIMAYVIGDNCQDCGACAAVCPAEAISEKDGKYVIDADACLDCGTCEAECPHGAISAE